MELRQARAGRPFTIAIRDAVHEAKDGDPLRAVTVIGPSNSAGLSLRRLLGSNLLDDTPRLGPAGIANVAFATPFQFASTVAANDLAASGRRPLTTAVLASAVRHVLRTSAGRFEAVAEHTATETALMRVYGELTELTPGQRAQLAAEGSSRTADLLGFVDSVAAHLASDSGSSGYHDEFAVYAAASEAIQRGSDSTDLIVLSGPYGQGASTLAFLAVVATRLDGIAVVALTGDVPVDKAAVGQLAAITGASSAVQSTSRPVPNLLVPAADSDEEVRAVLREVLRLAESGQSFDRIAVFHPVKDPYARTLREQFEAAGVPTAGPDHRRLADTMVGRLLGRLLDLATLDNSSRSKRLDRQGVLALAEAAPLRGADTQRVRSGPWENISRSAGVIGGLDDWREKLDRHVENIDSKLTNPMNAARSEGFFGALGREKSSTAELGDFVEWVHQLTDPQSIGSTWTSRAAWATDLLTQLLPPGNERARWPETEIHAADRVEVVLKRVGVLDSLEADAPWSAFVRAVELELAATAGSRGRIGTGVLIAPLVSSPGLDLDHVFVLGLAEGLCPRPVREDTLVNDEDRLAIAPFLATREDRLLEQRRAFLAAIAAGTLSSTLVMPTGDHRNGRPRTASRWWLEAMQSMGAGEHISSSRWRDFPLDQLRPEQSFTRAVESARLAGLATSPADLQLHKVLENPLNEALEPSLFRSISMARLRHESFNRFGGDLTAHELPKVVGPDKVISASRMEAWAKCPRSYYFAQVLGLGMVEAPDRIAEISALDRGTMWHAILEDFIAEALPSQPHAPTSPSDPWSQADNLRLLDHARRWFKKFEASGLTGRPLLWAIEIENLLVDLNRFIEEDSKMRAHLQTTPDKVELAIGIRTSIDSELTDPVTISLPDGRELHVRGFADRVDTRADGTPVVIDYKTGRAKIERKGASRALADDPVVGGTKLQLGVYAEAVKQHYGSERASAYYWFTSDVGRFERAGYEWTAARQSVFGQALGTITSGIEGGVFPPNPGSYDDYWRNFANCSFCAFDPICPGDRGVEHEVAIADPRLAPWLAMKAVSGFDEENES